ncbi:MAG: ATP-binding protein [Candidatus Aminicenantes bacterium]|nr:ATP-binding protein [Candidatus Aminicenantes bacterium]
MLNDLRKKMVFITGPRQVGKTFLAKQVLKEFKNPVYLNYDNDEDRKIILQRTWRLNTDVIIFDEIHKMKNWKMYLKGIYDGKPENQAILVTGSSRLDTFRQSGESLAGRYFHLRLNPLSVKELENMETSYNAIEKLNRLGAFPEPFLSGSEEEAARWRNQYYTDLIREDILDFSRIHEIKTMKLLLEMLRYRGGSPLSYSSLAGDLQISPNSVKKYIQILESLHIVFLLKPYYKQIGRSIRKEPKLYFYDTGFIKGDEGVKLENTTAVCLLKHIEYLIDVKGKNMSLNYLRTKDGKEIDFVISEDNEIRYLLEVKLSDSNLSKSLLSFGQQFSQAESFQLVHNLRQEEYIKGINLGRAGDFLAKLDA